MFISDFPSLMQEGRILFSCTANIQKDEVEDESGLDKAQKNVLMALKTYDP